MLYFKSLECVGRLDGGIDDIQTKLKKYNLHGSVQGKNLITTFETEEKPLDIEYVELLVKWYFL